MENKEIFSKLDYTDFSDIKLELTKGGFISLEFPDGKKYNRVNFFRTFPLTMPDELISVRDTDENEIALIKNIKDLSEEKKELVLRDLSRRYFVPEIKTIFKAKDEYGYVYMDIDTTSGLKTITVPNGSSNFVRLSDVRLILIDIDGNRFSINDYTALDKKSIRYLEALI